MVTFLSDEFTGGQCETYMILGDLVLGEVGVPGPPVAASGHLTEGVTLLHPSYVVTLSNLTIQTDQTDLTKYPPKIFYT